MGLQHVGSVRGLSTKRVGLHLCVALAVAWIGWLCLVWARSCSLACSQKLCSLSWRWQNCAVAYVSTNHSSLTDGFFFPSLQLTTVEIVPCSSLPHSTLNMSSWSSVSILPVSSSNDFPHCSNTTAWAGWKSSVDRATNTSKHDQQDPRPIKPCLWFIFSLKCIQKTLRRKHAIQK